ncbi:6650_t:CDS:2, partial [Acaulospora colombiana]
MFLGPGDRDDAFIDNHERIQDVLETRLHVGGWHDCIRDAKAQARFQTQVPDSSLRRSKSEFEKEVLKSPIPPLSTPVLPTS